MKASLMIIKKRIFQKISVVILLAALIFVALPNQFPLGIHADTVASSATRDVTVIEHTSMSAVQDILSHFLSDFDSTDSLSDLRSGSAAIDISAVSQPDSYPFTPFYGTQCALITKDNAIAGETLWLNYSVNGNIREADQTLFFALNPFPGNFDFSALKVILESPQKKVTYASSVTAENWNGVFVPLDSFDNPSKIHTIRIGITVPSGSSGMFCFAMDTLALSASSHPERLTSFLTDDFYSYGSSVSYISDSGKDSLLLTFLPSTAAPFIESYSLSQSALSGANTIRLRIENMSNCSSVSLFYTTDTITEFSSANSYTLPLSSGEKEQVLDFHIGNYKIKQIRFVFNGASDGTLSIASVSPVSSVYSSRSEYGQISSCRLTEAGDTVIVRGSLSSTAMSEFARGNIHLYVLAPWENEHETSFASKVSLRKVSMGESFSFSVPRIDGLTDRLCYKFVAVIVVDDQYYLMDDAKYISNPELLCANETALVSPSTQKGVTDLETDFVNMNALQYGISQTVVDLSISDLLSDFDSDYPYVFGERTYYFDRAVIDTLDTVISRAYRENIAVYLRLTLPDGFGDVLTTPQAPAFSSFVSYGFCVEKESTASCLCAVASFLAYRYATENGCGSLIGGVILGSNVDRAYQNYYLRKMNLCDFIAYYETVYRIFYNTMRSVSPALPLYISLSGQWNHELSTVNTYCYDALSVLENFAAKISLGGQIEWHLAVSPDTEKELAFSEKSIDDSIIYAENIDQLCETYSGLFSSASTASHSILLLNDEPVDLLRYTYTILKLSSSVCNAVTGYIVPSDCLMSDAEAYIALDQKDALEKLNALLSGTEAADWKEVIPSLVEANIAKRDASLAATGHGEEYTAKGSVLFSDFSSLASTDGWSTGYACTSIRTGEDYLGYSDTLFASMHTSDLPYASLQCDFDYLRNLEIAPCLVFNAYIVMLPEGVHEVKMTVIAQSGSDYAYADYILSNGTWNKIHFDISDFSGIDRISRIQIRISSVNGESIGDPTLILSGIRAESQTSSSNEIAAYFMQEKGRYTPAESSEISMKPVILRIALFVLAGSALLEIIHILVRAFITYKKKNSI